MRLIKLPGVDAPQGRWISLSAQRRFVCDLMRHAKRVPSVPSERRMRLAELIAARRLRPNRISWCAIFLKAYAIVSAERPELRRAYMPYIWPHLYEHPFNVASFSLERSYRGEEGVFFAKVRQPELLSLEELDALVRHRKQAPVESIPEFRQAMRLSSLPAPVRRLIWSLGLYSDGGYRAHFFGTFAVSAAASQGAAGLHILSPLTTTLNYGMFDADGSLDVRLTYDHRVLDGSPVARALTALESVLRSEILDELRDAEPLGSRRPAVALAS
ncbi:MAG TPA: hypothetical protein VGN12_25575 [Pirellulales bacterium]|jgi:hypothetical protein